jgi:hypothetical protein
MHMVRRGEFGPGDKLEKSPQKNKKKDHSTEQMGKKKKQLHGRCSVCHAVTSCAPPEGDRGVVQFGEDCSAENSASRVNEQEKLNNTFFS